MWTAKFGQWLSHMHLIAYFYGVWIHKFVTYSILIDPAIAGALSPLPALFLWIGQSRLYRGRVRIIFSFIPFF